MFSTRPLRVQEGFAAQRTMAETTTATSAGEAGRGQQHPAVAAVAQPPPDGDQPRAPLRPR